MTYLQDLQARREDAIRKIVREEIVNALGALARSADQLDMPYETAELDSRALENIKAAAEGAVRRLTCPHGTYQDWGPESRRCSRCGEPEPAPVNPFEDRGHIRGVSDGEPGACIDCGAPYREERTDG
jgi:hypothetical protein